MDMVLMFIAGLVVGGICTFTLAITKFKKEYDAESEPIGTLFVFPKTGEDPELYLNLSVRPEAFAKNKRATLNISQK